MSTVVFGRKWAEVEVCRALPTLTVTDRQDARFANERTGKVVVKFRLHPDGSVDRVKTESSEVGDLLTFFCESAIIEPNPYPRWPSELFDQHGKDPIEITFTFTYL